MSEEQTKQDRILMTRWGEHHWETLFWIEDWCVRAGCFVGGLSTMRTNTATHPEMVGFGFPLFFGQDTRLSDGSVVKGHDSWDCIDDLVAYGLVDASKSEEGKPQFELTDDGWAYASRLRKYFAEHKTLEGFTPIEDSKVARHHGWSVCLLAAEDYALAAYEDGIGSRNTKVKIEDGVLWIGENTGDFTEDAHPVPVPVVLDMLSRLGCSPVQFTKVSLEFAKQECVDIKDRHLAICDGDSDEAVAAQTAQDCEEAIQAIIDKCETDPPKMVVIPNDPWCDGCVHQKGAFFVPCGSCRRIDDGTMMGRTKHSFGRF